MSHVSIIHDATSIFGNNLHLSKIIGLDLVQVNIFLSSSLPLWKPLPRMVAILFTKNHLLTYTTSALNKQNNRERPK